MKQETKQLLIGMGIGVVVGGTTGSLIGYSVSKKRCTEEFKRSKNSIYNSGYYRGFEDSMTEAKKWIDDFQSQIVTVDPDNPEEALKAIQNASKTHSKADSGASGDTSDQEFEDEQKPVKTALEGSKTPYIEVPESNEPEPKVSYPEVKTEVDKIFESPKEPESEKKSQDPQVHTENPGPDQRFILTDDDKVHITYHTEVFEYPKSLFFDENGYSLGETRVRANLFEYEKNPVTLKKLWLSLGWGDYFPDPTTIALSEEELNNMDLAIDEQLGDEPEERTIERELYLDKVEKLRDHPVSCPKIVSQRRFDEDCYLNHIYVDYYDVDNVFVDSTEMEKELDAYTLFGVTDGKELFKYKAEHPFDPDDDNNDPEVVHVENFFDNSIAEITRYHKSYASVKDGSAYLDGGTT